MMSVATKRFSFSLLAIFLFGANAVCFGQAFTANLSGIVTDPQAAVIPGVSVQVKNTATNETRTTTTGEEGRYTFSQLLPGTYDVTAEIPGFKTFRELGLVLRGNQSAELNIPMQIGEVAQSVEVRSSPVMLDTQSANQSVTLTAQQITELPMNTRTPFALVLALAGTTALTARTFSSQTLDQQFGRFALNGGRDMSSLVLLDGVPATAGDWGGLIISPSVDSVQEMQVLRNSYDAEFGRSGGGVVSVVTRSGSGKFHGTVFEFHRNDNLDANNWSNNRARRAKTEFKRNQFGGNLGGPLWKGKNLFFFAGYEGLRESFPGNSGFQRVPTDLERRGDFSQTFNPDGSLAVIYNPFTTRVDPANPGRFIRDPFQGNKIPDNLIDPVAAKVISFYPQPNQPGNPVTHVGNFFAAGSGQSIRDEFDGRIDWAHNTKHTVYGRLSMVPRLRGAAPRFFGNGFDTSPDSSNPRFQVTIGNTFVPTPVWVINVLLGVGRWREQQLSPSVGVADSSVVGLSPSLFQASVVPVFAASTYATLGNQQVRNFPRYTNTLQGNVTRELGLHSIKFGVSGESDLINNSDRFSGFFGFNRGMTSGPVAANDSTTTGNSIASLLLGTGSSGGAETRAEIAASLRYYAGYVQDTWRVSKSLTLNVGLRYELQRPATERFNRLAYFDTNAANPIGQRVGLNLKGGFRFVTAEDRGQWKGDKNDLAPRLGIAYKITDRLVVRAGYGVFYVPASSLFTFDPVPGISVTTPWVTSNGFFPADLLRNPYPQGLLRPTGLSAGLETQVGFSPSQVWFREPHPTGNKQNYSLDFQYEITRGTIFELGYSGFQARKLVFGNTLPINQLPSTHLSLGAALNELVPNPFFGQITSGNLRFATIPRHRLLRPFPQFDFISSTRSTPGASASFNALNIKFTRQFSAGLALISSYQWSKNIDDASEDQGWANNDGWRDYYNRRLDRSLSAHDVPHSFVTNLIYELPVGKGRKFGLDLPGAAEAVIGGWQISSIIRFADGFPQQVFGTDAGLGQFGFARFRPNMVTNQIKLDDRTPQNWFNKAAFVNAAPFTIGNAPRYIGQLREDSIRNVDLALAKNFRLEAFKLQFRADFLNLFNTPQFGGLSTFTGNADFGQATSSINLPRNIQVGLKISF